MSSTESSTPAGPPRIRLIALGDELLAGVGDARALGWLGRAVASEQGPDARIDLFTSAIPQETSAELAERWTQDVSRLTDAHAASAGLVEHRVVLGLGSADVTTGISLARSRLNLAKVLDGLERMRTPAFVVGPPPGLDRGRNQAIRELSAAFHDVCARRRVDYVDMVGGLEGHDQWIEDLSRTGGERPGQTGYGLMAWLVLHGGFGRWLGTD
ncbi:lysophospholipase [Brachybacterium sp. EF45031]|uniref:GDSL-type esterase/lipase family protein n=1 Tax=Brachybacterium sillae TaxID=2810536 RepID=UPI00217ED0B8|nr:GDSL-type esterase/lipase family protein [Brachybacterium sillae]MCS6710938.1 lysophospholipase [Brachybacterium sillae]